MNRILLWIIAALVVAGSASTILLKLQVSKLQVENATLQATADTAIALNARFSEANEELLLAVESEHAARVMLQAALEDALARNKKVTQAADSARRAKAKADAERDRAIAALQNERMVIYASNPDCDAWGRSLMCSAVSDGLRVKWAAAQSASQSGGGGGDSGSGAIAFRAYPAGIDSQASTTGPPAALF